MYEHRPPAVPDTPVFWDEVERQLVRCITERPETPRRSSGLLDHPAAGVLVAVVFTMVVGGLGQAPPPAHVYEGPQAVDENIPTSSPPPEAPAGFTAAASSSRGTPACWPLSSSEGVSLDIPTALWLSRRQGCAPDPPVNKTPALEVL
jgi:hypothetical protein